MKKLKLIYNPNAGSGGFKYDLEPCVHIFQNAGYETHLFKSMERGDIGLHLSRLDVPYDAIAVSGGDGTVNNVIEAMLTNKLNIPVGIIPSGTANDFATFLKLPQESDKAAEVIAGGNTQPIDIGIANNRYFINVCGAGLFTNISHSVDGTFKSMLGKLAYYIKGLEQIPGFEQMYLRIINSKETICENLYLYVILNTSGAGGLVDLSPEAKVDDGELDFIGFKEMPLIDLAALFIKFLRGEHLEDPNVIFFRDSEIQIESVDENLSYETDVDGEPGPEMPIKISVAKKAIEVFAP